MTNAEFSFTSIIIIATYTARGTAPLSDTIACETFEFASLAQPAPSFAPIEIASWVSEALCESVREAA